MLSHGVRVLKQFDVFVEDRPGSLARVAEVLGANGVNIKAIASERAQSRPLIRIVTDDERTARSALDRAGISYAIRDLISLRLADRPGELGKVARRLARAMVNVDSIYILNKNGGFTELAITVDNPEKAATLLKSP